MQMAVLRASLAKGVDIGNLFLLLNQVRARAE